MIGLYALEECLEMAAFAQGLEAASLRYKWRNHNFFDETEDFDLVVVSGLRGKGTEIRDAYNAKGVQVIVIDYGYLNRVYGMATWQTGHWQVGLNRLGWIPLTAISDRYQSLAITLQPRQSGKYILVCGQHAGDPSHGFDEDGISQWAATEIAKIKKHTNNPVLWRPHPDSAHVEVSGHDGISSGPVNWPDVCSIVCINSNIGLEAVINGVPVFCRNDAPYKELGNDDISMLHSPYFPDDRERLDYLNRVAYAQWTLDEIRQGDAINYLRSTL